LSITRPSTTPQLDPSVQRQRWYQRWNFCRKHFFDIADTHRSHANSLKIKKIVYVFLFIQNLPASYYMHTASLKLLTVKIMRHGPARKLFILLGNKTISIEREISSNEIQAKIDLYLLFIPCIVLFLNIIIFREFKFKRNV
jgi:hypothetical protein